MQESIPKKIQKSASLEKWRCQECFFDNLNLLNNCEICETPRKEKIPAVLSHEPKSKQEGASIECSNKSCKTLNSLFEQNCKICMEPLFPQEQDYGPKKIQNKLIKCTKCTFDNDPANLKCVNCDARINRRKIPMKSVKPRARPMNKYCSECHTYYLTSPQNDYGCPHCQEDIEDDPLAKKICVFCFEKPLSSEQHQKVCEGRLNFYDRKKNPTFERCTPLQIDTMYYMHNKCEKLHYKKYGQLLKKIEKMGFNATDLENLHHYIINYAPIIIHMHTNTHFQFFLKDTHYRNQFQTAKSSGSLSHSARTSWQDRMFDHRHHSATGFQRVKYGTMNFTNDPSGVKACVGYGQSYFLLKPHVRNRCTITDMDSSSPSATLGTFIFCYHLLNKLSQAELRSAFEGSKGKQMLSHVIGAYKQIQIHGPVQFSKDIERVYISKPELKLGNAQQLLGMVKEFCEKNKLEYEIFENSHAPAIGLFGAAAIEQKADRIVEDKKELTADDLKPLPPVPAHGFLSASSFGAYILPPSASLFSPSFAFGIPAPKKQVRPKTFGIDYI